MNNKLKIFFAVAGVLLVGVLAFLYRFITNFPIGDDPAVHIRTVVHTSYSGLLGYNYPLSLVIFKFLGQITHIPYQSLFIPMECGTLFSAALALWLLAKKITNSNLMAVISSLFFVTSYWTYDGLRMGLMAEIFGWLILILTLYFLVSKKLWWTILFSVILIFSHPYSFTIYCLLFAVYAPVILIFAEKDSKIFIVKLLGCYLILALLAFFAKPDLIHKFLNFVNPERIGWGEHNLFVFFTASQLRRVYIAIFALIGIVANIKNWKKDTYKFLYTFLFIGMFMAFNQYFGIRFQVFRFFPYFEMPVVIFAALGIDNIIKIFNFQKRFYIVSWIVLALFVLIPQVYANERVTYGQSQIARNDNSMTLGDREAINWINKNVDNDELLALPYKRLIWILALTDHSNVDADDAISEKQSSDFKVIGSYIYFPEIYPVPESIKNNFEEVYGKDGVKIYQVVQ